MQKEKGEWIYGEFITEVLEKDGVESAPHRGLEYVEALAKIGEHFGLSQQYNNYIGYIDGRKLNRECEEYDPELSRRLNLIALFDQTEEFQEIGVFERLFSRFLIFILKTARLDIKGLKLLMDNLINQSPKSEKQWQNLTDSFERGIAVLPKALKQWQTEEWFPAEFKPLLSEVVDVLEKEGVDSLLGIKLIIELFEGTASLVNLHPLRRSRFSKILLMRFVDAYRNGSIKTLNRESMEELQSYELLDNTMMLRALEKNTSFRSSAIGSYQRSEIGYSSKPKQDAVSAVRYEDRLRAWEEKVRLYNETRTGVQNILSILQTRLVGSGNADSNNEWVISHKVELLNIFENFLSSRATENAWNYWSIQAAPRGASLFDGYSYSRIAGYSEFMQATNECIKFVRVNQTKESDEMLILLLSFWGEKLKLLYELKAE